MLFRWFDVIRVRLRALTRRGAVEAELDRELQAHLDAMVDENIRRGMSPADARHAAKRDFGHVEVLKEEARDARGVAFVENLVRDLRYTLRGLLREPLLLFTATVSIALGAAGNIAVFSLAKELVFGQPDVSDPDRVVAMRVSHTSHVSLQRWRDLHASGVIEELAGYDMGHQINWFRGDATVPLGAPMMVTANFFDMLGPPMALGRGFTTDEARVENDPRVVVVSHSFWQGELGGDTAVLGRTLILNGSSYTIIGVLAEHTRSIARLGLAPRVYVPFNRSLDPDLLSPTAQRAQLVGRLKPDQTLAEARAALDAVDRRLARAAGDSLYGGVQQFGPIGNVGDSKLRMVRAFFAILTGVSLLVVLIGCGNVAGLLMARGAARRPEIMIRLAIGGTRSRLIQQLMVEAFWLATIGTLAGLALALIALRAIESIPLPIALPVEMRLGVDVPVMLCAVALIVATMFASALLPALGATRTTLQPALWRDDSRPASRRLSARGMLLAGQVTVATLLLVVASLFLRNLQRSQLAHPGFDIEGVYVSEIGFVRGGERAEEQQRLLLSRLAERARTLPGVTSVAVATSVPLSMNSGSSNGRSILFDGNDRPRHVEYSQVDVGSNYFATLGIRLVSGRDFGPADREGAPAAVIVDEEFARRHLDGRAVGRRFRFDGDGNSTMYEIVGVVANSKYRTIGEELRGAMYTPLAQRPMNRGLGFVFTRATGDETLVRRELRSALSAVDRASSVDVQPMRAAMTFALMPSRIGAAITGGLGLLGLTIAAVGLLALVSYNVARRTREIAIRAALGASRAGILRLVVRDALAVVALGLALGIGIAGLATRGLTAFLVTGLSATDPVSFLATAAVFLTVTVLASWFPARRATRVSPAIAMRAD